MRILTCLTCSERKLDTEFYRKKSVHGRELRCKECVKERVRSYREKNIDRVREYDRSRGQLPHRKEGVRLRANRYKPEPSKWRSRNEDKYRAHIALGNAIRDGRITRPDRCERCSSSYAVQGHHEDYSKPFEVMWLCPRCHGARHREINEERRQAMKGVA